MAKQNHGITDRDTAQWSALREAKDKKLKQFEDLGLRTSSNSNAAAIQDEKNYVSVSKSTAMQEMQNC